MEGNGTGFAVCYVCGKSIVATTGILSRGVWRHWFHTDRAIRQAEEEREKVSKAHTDKSPPQGPGSGVEIGERERHHLITQ